MAFLDFTGLSHFLDKLKTIFVSSSEKGVASGVATLDSNGKVPSSQLDLSSKLDASLKGANNGVAELDSSGKVPTSQLPAYVDDVVDGYYYNDKFWEEDTHTTEIPGESGKIYVDLDTNKTYRWSGTTFVVIASDLALGETSSTAYRGDRGAAAYAAAVTNVESTPSSGSSNLITSGGVYTALGDKADKTDTVLLTTLSMGRKANTTVGTNSTALGEGVTASGSYSFGTGSQTNSTGAFTFAEGYGTTAFGNCAHAEGRNTTANGNYSHSEGYYTNASGSYGAHAEGYGSSSSQTSYGALGQADHAEGYQTKANSGSSSNYGAHAEGYMTKATNNAAHAEGYTTQATNYAAHAEGRSTIASGSYSHAEGCSTTASGSYSHAEGYSTTAGSYSHAEGCSTAASGSYSHAEGKSTAASGLYSHAEGYSTTASGDYSHAEGNGVRASNSTAISGVHAFGRFNYDLGYYVATVTDAGSIEWEPYKPYLSHSCALKHTENGVTTYYVPHNDVPAYIDPMKDYVNGFWHPYTLPDGTDPATIPEWDKDTLYEANSVVKELYNGTYYYFQNHNAITTTYFPLTNTNYYHTVSLNSTYPQYRQILEEVGNGISSAQYGRSNARTLDLLGNEYLAGDLYVGCNADSTGGTKVATTANLSDKADKDNTVITGSLSLNRKANTTVGDNSVALGNGNESSSSCSFAEGYQTTASGSQSHAEGQGSTASSYQSHAEGYYTTASGPQAHTEGNGTTASGAQSHAEGYNTTASGSYAHSEGSSTIASNVNAHAEGGSTVAAGTYTHTEGRETTALGTQSHAEGQHTLASGIMSHTEGYYTTAIGLMEHVSGQYNALDSAPSWVSGTVYYPGDLVLRNATFTDSSGTERTRSVIYRCKTMNNDSTFTSSKWGEYGTCLFVVGNGTADNMRSNAVAVDWNGNQYLKGDAYVNCNSNSTGGMKLATVNTIASEYDSTATYAVGDYCIYNGKLYKCSTAISTAEAWTAAHWTETKLVDESPDLSIYAPKANPVFTGTVSLGRKANTTVGVGSVTLGVSAEASGMYSHAEGQDTKAAGSVWICIAF